MEPTELPGVWLDRGRTFTDERGVFRKVFNRSAFAAAGLNTDWRESYYSVSRANVVRGMHFQLPPHDHEKLVCVPHGEVLDVVLDLRADSPAFGRATGVRLSAENRWALYLPRGCAHGFRALAEGTVIVCFTATEHDPAADTGVRWDSFGFDWGTERPIVSARDAAFEGLDAFRRRKIAWGES